MIENAEDDWSSAFFNSVDKGKHPCYKSGKRFEIRGVLC